MKKSLSCLTLLLAGCSLAPDFKLPEMLISPEYKEAHDAGRAPIALLDQGEAQGSWKVGDAAPAQERGEWWKAFNDPDLTTLVEQVAAENLNVQATVARVRQARGASGIADSSLFPALDATAGYTRQKLSSVTPGLPIGTTLPIYEAYNTGLLLNYELDLFGARLNERRSAQFDLAAGEANLRSVTLTAQADVANMYFSLRSLDAERALLADEVKFREESVGILNKRLNAGLISELDVTRETVDLETVRTQLLGVIAQHKQLEHALAVMLGKTPAEFSFDEKPLATTPPIIPAGLPSTLLERRPDIASAQDTLAAANARIGIARAAFFPSISLTAAGGLEATSLSDLFKWSNRTWAIGPLVSIPIFSGGAATGNLERSKGVYDEAVAIYKQQVLNAFKDVEDSLSSLNALAGQAAASNTAVKAAARADDLAQKRYDAGEIGQFEQLDVQRQTLAVKRQSIQLQRDRLIQTVQFIRALGGSWDAPAEAAPQAPAPAQMMPGEPVQTNPVPATEQRPVTLETPKDTSQPVKPSLAPVTSAPVNPPPPETPKAAPQPTLLIPGTEQPH